MNRREAIGAMAGAVGTLGLGPVEPFVSRASDSQDWNRRFRLSYLRHWVHQETGDKWTHVVIHNGDDRRETLVNGDTIWLAKDARLIAALDGVMLINDGSQEVTLEFDMGAYFTGSDEFLFANATPAYVGPDVFIGLANDA